MPVVIVVDVACGTDNPQFGTEPDRRRGDARGVGRFVVPDTVRLHAEAGAHGGAADPRVETGLRACPVLPGAPRLLFLAPQRFFDAAYEVEQGLAYDMLTDASAERERFHASLDVVGYPQMGYPGA